MKQEKERSTLHRKKNRIVFKECYMCHRLVPSSEIRHLRTKLPTGQTIPVQVCKLCIVDPNKTRFYIAQQLRKKK